MANPITNDVDDDEESSGALGAVFATLGQRWKTLTAAAFGAGVVALGVAFLIPPTYTARTVILPPQQQGSSGAAAAALSSLGALAGLAGGAVKSPAEQYVSLMKSVTVTDRIIDKYKLMEVYDDKYKVDTRKRLDKLVVITAGKKDGLITIDVDDKVPQRAADIANDYVDGLRFMTNNLAVSEAQQRRMFFENKLKDTKDKLTEAQIQLQDSGYSPGALKAEPKAAAEGYAKARAQVTSAEVKLQALRRMLADGTPEVVQQEALLTALRTELKRLESNATAGAEGGGQDYVTRYREFKYQETLFELFARQYEAARLDEGREGALVQVVDKATAPERKSKPKRAVYALVGALLGLVAASVVVVRRAARAV